MALAAIARGAKAVKKAFRAKNRNKLKTVGGLALIGTGTASIIGAGKETLEFIGVRDSDEAEHLPEVEVDYSEVTYSKYRKIVIRINVQRYLSLVKIFQPEDVLTAFETAIRRSRLRISERYASNVKSSVPVRTGKLKRSIRVTHETVREGRRIRGFSLTIDARVSASRGGGGVFYFSVLDAKLNLTHKVFLDIRSWSVKVLEEELNAEIDILRAGGRRVQPGGSN